MSSALWATSVFNRQSPGFWRANRRREPEGVEGQVPRLHRRQYNMMAAGRVQRGLNEVSGLRQLPIAAQTYVMLIHSAYKAFAQASGWADRTDGRLTAVAQAGYGVLAQRNPSVSTSVRGRAVEPAVVNALRKFSRQDAPLVPLAGLRCVSD